MNIKRNNKGFTMMEMLVAVGIMVGLFGLAFVGVITYQRTLKQTELDATAREIFVAAQNHLTMAKSQGNLAKLDQGWQSEGASDDVYYYFVDGPNEAQLDASNAASRSSALYYMLPEFSLDDTVRRGKSYVIAYNPASGAVLDVFYSDQSDLSKHTFTTEDHQELFVSPGYTGEDKASNRLSGYNNAIIGWYGGDDLGDASPNELAAPDLKIVNAECLMATLDMTDAYNTNKEVDTGAKVQLIIEGATSGAQRVVQEYELSAFLADATQTVILDDITASGKHFSDQPWCKTGTNVNGTSEPLIPGENIALYAKVYSNKVLAKEAKTAKKHTNSLFASVADEEVAATAGKPASTRKVARVDNIRHLENLDVAISGYDLTGLGDDAAYVAQQTADVQWSGDGSAKSHAFLDKIAGNEDRATSVTADKVQVYYQNDTATAEGTYAPVNPTYQLTYEGQGHTIANVKVNTSANAGLFGTLNQEDTSVKDLKLVDFNVTSTSQAAGALAGAVDGSVAVSNVAAYNSSASITKDNSAVKGSTAAGGLVGSFASGTLTESAAALYVEATGMGGAAGGLVGTSANGSLSKCYAGGHLVQTDAEGNKPKTVTYSTTEGNVVASGPSGVAGGLVGIASSTPIEHCYATCSAFGKFVAGGLVGTTTGSTIKNSYATGLVGSATGTADLTGVLLGAFVGDNAGTTFENDNYLDIINQKNAVRAVSTDTDETKAEGISEADANTDTYLAFMPATSTATPYASNLTTFYGGKYAFKTADELASAKDGKTASATHYGDWPAPETLMVNAANATSVKTYSLSINKGDPHYVNDSAVLTLMVSVDGADPVPVEGTVAWTSSNADSVTVSGDTYEANLGFAAIGESTISASVEGAVVASMPITVVAQSDYYTPVPEPSESVDHTTGYVIYHELNHSVAHGGYSDLAWEEKTDANGTQYRALLIKGAWANLYAVVYYNGSYYKPIHTFEVDTWAGLGTDSPGYYLQKNFTVDLLDSNEYYNDSLYSYSNTIKWVKIDGPTEVPISSCGPTARAFATSSSDANYAGDCALTTALGNDQMRASTDWEPYRSRCMVAAYHVGGTDNAVAMWFDDNYYVPRTNGQDTSVQLYGTDFTNAHLTDGIGHTYNGTTVIWTKIANPYA